VAAAYVTVSPDSDHFAEELAAQLEREDFRLTVPVDPDMDGFREKVAAGTAGEPPVEVRVEPDLGGFAAKLAAAVAAGTAAGGALGGAAGGGGAGGGGGGGLFLGGFGRLGVGGLFTLANAFTVVHLAAAVLGAQIVADAIGIAAFGAEASRAVGPAVTAASSVANLTTQYAALDPFQQAAALSLKSFTDGLQIADEAGIFGVFYQGLNLVQTGLSHTGGIVSQATNAFGDFFGMLKADLGSPVWARVFGGTTGIIRTDLDALFNLINAGINVIPGLFHNLNFLGTGFLGVAAGVLRAVGAITEWNPELTKAAALAGVAYGAYKVLWAGLGAGPGPLARMVTGLRGATIATTAFAMNARAEGIGAALAYAGISTSALAVGAGAAVAAVGIGAMVLALNYSANAAGRQVAALRQADQATGNNVAGYQAMDRALTALSGSQQAVAISSDAAAASGSKIAGAVQAAAAVLTGPYAQALASNRAALAAISVNAQHFGQMLGLSKSQVIAFANATGIDLSHSLSVSGTQFVIDASKLKGYAASVALSHNPLSQFMVDAQQASNAANSLADQVTALTAAYGALITPTLNVIQGQLTMKNDMVSASTAIQASNGLVGQHTALQRAAGLAIVQAANDAITLSENIKTQTGSTRLAIGPLQTFVTWLEATGAKGAYVHQILRLIRQAEDGLYNRPPAIFRVDIITSGGTPPQIHIPGVTGGAFGGVVPGYAPGRDSVLMAVSPGEGLLVPEAVRGLGAGFVHWANRAFGGSRVTRGNKTGTFASGGIADSRSHAPVMAAAGRQAPVVNVNYFGPQAPSREQEQAMLLKIAYELGTAG